MAVSQTSWPQVNFERDEDVTQFVLAHSYGSLRIMNHKYGVAHPTFFGWISPGQLFLMIPNDIVYIKCNSDRWTDENYIVNPDAKMPDDNGWAWCMELVEPWRVGRQKCDLIIRPIFKADLLICRPEYKEWKPEV